MTDQERFEFVLDIVTGEDTPEANQRTFAIGVALTKGFCGRDAIDEAARYLQEQRGVGP